MRKTAAALITLGLAALALAGCSAGPSFAGQACSSKATSSVLTNSVTVKGEFGKAPEVSFATPTKVQKSSVDDLITGTGSAITEKNQPIVIDVALYDAKTGQSLGSTSFDGSTQVADVNTWDGQLKTIGDALGCATAGSRLLVGFPAGTVAEGGAVAVVDVQKVFLPHAEGSLVYNDALGLPTVVRAPDGRPGIIVPDAKKPAKQVTQTLIRGTGAKVTKDDVLRVQLTSVDWDTRKVLKSTWDAQSVAISATGLEGQTVGSQVLLVIPPADANQSTGADGNGTQAIVVDILGVDTSASLSSGQ
ncbi:MULTISPECIES: FKBP-type peptidyl-prolyl cis-trans isomerase [unclassified Microbacterium]|uniref:FKBP-type peptidyl-prolyl cis-trans isomerase n=1 Tax=unclassified Microbacterium TaxID=2609290 RepID=UPI00301717D5